MTSIYCPFTPEKSSIHFLMDNDVAFRPIFRNEHEASQSYEFAPEINIIYDILEKNPEMVIDFVIPCYPYYSLMSQDIKTRLDICTCNLRDIASTKEIFGGFGNIVFFDDFSFKYEIESKVYPGGYLIIFYDFIGNEVGMIQFAYNKDEKNLKINEMQITGPQNSNIYKYWNRTIYQNSIKDRSKRSHRLIKHTPILEYEVLALIHLLTQNYGIDIEKVGILRARENFWASNDILLNSVICSEIIREMQVMYKAQDSRINLLYKELGIDPLNKPSQLNFDDIMPLIGYDRKSRDRVLWGDVKVYDWVKRLLLKKVRDDINYNPEDIRSIAFASSSLDEYLYPYQTVFEDIPQDYQSHQRLVSIKELERLPMFNDIEIK